MGLFSGLKSMFGNKYEKHPDVLDQMAKTMARWAMEQLRDDTKPGERGITFVLADSSSSLTLSNKPEGESYHGEKYTSYGLKFSKFGMAEIPKEDGGLFLDAFYPYLEKHIKAIVGNYFPGSYATVRQTYHREECWYDTTYNTFPVIEIRVPGADKATPPKPTYKAW